MTWLDALLPISALIVGIEIGWALHRFAIGQRERSPFTRRRVPTVELEPTEYSSQWEGR